MILAPLPKKNRVSPAAAAAGGDYYYGSSAGLLRYDKNASHFSYKVDQVELQYIQLTSKGNRQFIPSVMSSSDDAPVSHYYDTFHENQWSRLLWSLLKTGAVYLPKKAVSNIDADSIINGRPIVAASGTAQLKEYRILDYFLLLLVEMCSGGGIAQSRTPQIVEKTKKQNPLPWLINLAGPPGVPGI